VLPTFVIGLREGLEASLIVGIVAAFLGRQGRRDALRQVWIGVGVAVAICIAVGVGLQIATTALPQRQQEGLETVVGLFAVAMVTYMILWMRKHARDLKGQLEGAAAAALAQGSARALVLMAFLAVLREGFETAVFLLATFRASGNAAASATGAVLGIAVAVVLGYCIYRGGVRINLSRFFRATGVVLIVVAAGLVMTAVHTANEAGWLNVGQTQAFDLSWLIHPGTALSAVLTGVLGLQVYPVWIEVAAYLIYLVPMLALTLWPTKRRQGGRRQPASASVPEPSIAAQVVAAAPSAAAVSRAAP
jgi:high-affinity iron transporter